MKAFLIISLLFALSHAADITITWSGSCSGNGFGFTFAATNGGGAFQPDAHNGNVVPCDEYFEVSFSVVDTAGNVINFPAITNQGTVFGVNNILDTNGVVTVKMIPENGQWGSGFINGAGATTVSTGQPFTLVCANNVGNIKIKTNYMLTATNDGGTPNYARTLDTITDTGAWGTGIVITPPANPPASFGVGQSQCVNAQFVTTFAYPAGVLSGSTQAPAPAPTTQAPTTQAPPTKAPTTQAPTTQAPPPTKSPILFTIQQTSAAANQPTSAAANGQATSAATPSGPTIPFVPIKNVSAGSTLVYGLLALFCLFLVFF